jgi:outer membrane protein
MSDKTSLKRMFARNESNRANRLRGLRPLSAVLALSLAAAPAFAQDATTTPHRFNATVGYAHMVPRSDPGSIAGSRADFDGSGAPTVSGSWFVNDNVAVELWGSAGKFENDVNLANGARGTVKQQPVALSGQYHFGTPDRAIRPYLGLGYYQANIDDEQFDATATGDQHVGIGTPDGAMATAGVDFNITDRWFARADARYLHGKSDVRVGGQDTGEELQLNPWVVGVGVGVRF